MMYYTIEIARFWMCKSSLLHLSQHLTQLSALPSQHLPVRYQIITTITLMGAQNEVSSASPKRVWVVIGASHGIGEEYVAQVH